MPELEAAHRTPRGIKSIDVCRPHFERLALDPSRVLDRLRIDPHFVLRARNHCVRYLPDHLRGYPTFFADIKSML
jgi:hypothetical protein